MFSKKSLPNQSWEVCILAFVGLRFVYGVVRGSEKEIGFIPKMPF